MLNISLSYQQEGFWAMWFGTGATLNTGHYSNPQVDELFTKAKSELDGQKRSDLYAQASAIVTKDAPWLFVVDDKNPRALAPNVKGFIEPKSWFADLTTITVGSGAQGRAAATLRRRGPPPDPRRENTPNLLDWSRHARLPGPRRRAHPA